MSRIDATDVTDANGDVDPDAVGQLIADIGEAADRDRTAFEPPSEPPDHDRALRYLREGLGRAVGTYIILRTDDRRYRFGSEEFNRLEGAMNVWLELYAACHGMEIDASHSIRTAAETLLETDDVRAVAEVLTGVPCE